MQIESKPDLLTRDGTLTKDARTNNLLDGDKRPGLSLAVQLPAGAAQGTFMSNTLGACAIVNNNIYTVPAGTLVAAIPSGVGPYDIVGIATSGVVVLKDAQNMWTLTGSTIVKVMRSALNPVSWTLPGSGGTPGTYALTITGDGAGATGTYTIGADGTITAANIAAGGDNYTYANLTTPLGGITGVTGLTAGINALPYNMIPGIVQLDQTVYVATAAAVISGSAIGDATSWLALNTILAYGNTDAAVSITRYLNYVVLMKDRTAEVFYDAGNVSPGSPLSRYPSAYMEIGCASAGSIVGMQNLTMYMSKDKDRGRVMRSLVNLQMSTLSTKFIEKILDRSTLAAVYSFGLTFDGHSLYVLTLPDIDLTLWYDHEVNKWGTLSQSTANAPKSVTSITQQSGLATAIVPAHGVFDGDPVTFAGATPVAYNGRFNVRVLDANTLQFVIASTTASPATGTITATGYTQHYFRGVNVINTGTKTVMQDVNSGAVYYFDATVYTDVGAPIDCQVVTHLLQEGKTGSIDHLLELEVIADKVLSNAYLRYTKDDYQTWSYYGTLYLNDFVSSIQRLGYSRQRAFQLRHTDATSFRISTLNLDVTGGA